MMRLVAMIAGMTLVFGGCADGSDREAETAELVAACEATKQWTQGSTCPSVVSLISMLPCNLAEKKAVLLAMIDATNNGVGLDAGAPLAYRYRQAMNTCND